jgi:predicted RNA-binding Zn-ribbon protein involved in translation (DUF1610 family)
MKKAKNSSQMKKMKYRCPKCNSVQRVEYSPIMSRTLQCDKCGARFITASSKPEADAKGKEIFQSSLVPCEDCGKEISSRAEKCPNCGAPTLNTRPKRQKKWPATAAVTLLVAAILIVIGFGFVHVINGSSLPHPRIVHKDSFGYSETFINIDKITGMPWVFARSKYPIGCRILQKKGHIESDEARERRISKNSGSNTLAKSFVQR